ncbi:MAG: VWA domain-containing protein [Thermoanaerobaculia bacterium]
MKSTALALLLVTLAPGLLAAESQVPYIETFEVRLHNLDVVVTDAKGQPVHGLTKDDFVVLEKGVPQEVTNFSYFDESATHASIGNDGTHPAEAAVEPPPRHIVFFMDDVELWRNTRARLYTRLQEFVNTMRDGDVASVVRPTAENKVALAFTGDRAAIQQALKAAIDDSTMRLSGFTADVAQLRLALGRGDNPAQAKREYVWASRRRIEHRLGQIRALTSSMADIEGRKVLVMVTFGLGAEPGSEAWTLEEDLNLPQERPFDQVEDGSDTVQRLERREGARRYWQNVIDNIARSAAANGITIYAVEPDVRLELSTRGAASVPVKAGSASGGSHFVGDSSRSIAGSFGQDLLQNSAATLDSLAGRTGGKWFRGPSGINDTFTQINNDLGTYYSLAYRANGQEGPRSVQVQVRNRPDLKVRTRTEVLEKSTAREMDDLVAASLIYPRPVNELAIAVNAGEPVKARGYYTIPIDVVVPMNKLTFLPTNDGSKYVASFNVHFALAGRDRNYLQGGKAAQTVEITPEQYQNISGINYRYKTGINVSEGSSKIAIGLIDETTRLTGFGTVEVSTR